MKKIVAMFMAMFMMLVCSVTALAVHGPLTVNQAKQAALDYAGVKAEEATFTKAHRDWDDGREVYEIEFYAENTEFDMDVDVNTGRITEFSTEYHGGFNSYGNQAPANTQPQNYGRYHDWDDDWDDWDDRYDFDMDDMFDWDD